MVAPTEPFRVYTLGGSGLTRTQARHPRYLAPSRSLRIPAEIGNAMLARIQAVALAAPDGALFCGPSAATLLDLPIPFRLSEGPVSVDG
jgi:hypothetical protein